MVYSQEFFWSTDRFGICSNVSKRSVIHNSTTDELTPPHPCVHLKIEALASRVATSRVLLVILAGRQGASTDVVASRLAVELMVKGKNPTVVSSRY